MANVLFTRTSNPSSKAIVDGQIILSTAGDGNIYLDNGTTRLKMGGEAGTKVSLNDVANSLKECQEVPEDNQEISVPSVKVINEINNMLGGDNNGVDIRINPVTGEPEWKRRGADSYNPFKRSGSASANNKIKLKTKVVSGTISKSEIEAICAEHDIDASTLQMSNFIQIPNGAGAEISVRLGKQDPFAYYSEGNYTFSTGIFSQYMGAGSVSANISYGTISSDGQQIFNRRWEDSSGEVYKDIGVTVSIRPYVDIYLIF